ncbi:MAG: 2Fe-2S iron-sulfur cluster binding domain-containing protein [Firmicutes bacterium]|nr:2Fe-2S iron-sulfur cluster binding domain-containing protein [Bacillota bacterium]
MEYITLTVDGQTVQVEKGKTVLDAIQAAGIKVPTLCYHPELRPEGACRLCVVEVKGAKTLVASCVAPAADGMEVKTNTPFVREARRTALELLLANHPNDCLTCERNGNCELQTLAHDLGVREVRYQGPKRSAAKDASSPAIVRDPEKCILCGRCVRMCGEVQEVAALGYVGRGWDTMVLPLFDRGLAEVACVNCGQCTTVCPTGAITEKSYVDEVWDALGDPNKHVIVQTAPAVRVSVAEALGMPVGTIATGKMVAGLRRLGFDRVFDTDFTADLTIIEEGHELLERLNSGGTLPLITSCSPGWIKFCEHFYPDLLPHLSTCKSPQQMFGAVAKTYYAEKMGLKPEDIYVVSIMPCTAKKFEAQRPEMTASGVADVDAVLTTRELARMFKEAGIDFATLPDEEYDAPLGISTGAGAIFGATGGVMEAALRTVYEVVTGETLENLDFTEVRGLEGVKEASVDLNGKTVKVAVAHGLANAKKVLERIKAGEGDWQFVEIMCCPGGCIGGGGQPIPVDREKRAARIKAIYEVDASMPMRKSHENPAVVTLYQEFLGKPLSEKSHELLHTHYTPRPRF